MAGMIVAAQPETVEAGALVLRQDGNTVDAAIACAFVQSKADKASLLGARSWPPRAGTGSEN